MKKYLILVLLTIAGFISKGQTYDNPHIYGLIENRLQVDSAQQLPRFSSPRLATNKKGSGFIFYNTSDTALYIYDSTSWHKVGSAGVGSGTVTSVTATATNGLSVTGSPITSSGILGFTLDTVTPSTGIAQKSYVDNSITGLGNNFIKNQYSFKQTANSWQDTNRASTIRVDSGIKTQILIEQDNLLVNSSGFSAFNGGTITYNSVPHTLTVSSTSKDKGVNIGGTLSIGRKYQLSINVTSGTGGAMTFSVNSLTYLTTLHNGYNTLTFVPTTGASPTITCSKSGNFTINSYKLYTVPLDSNNDMALRGDVQTNIPYYNQSGNGIAIAPFSFANTGGSPGTAIGYLSDASPAGSVSLGLLAVAAGSGNDIVVGNASYTSSTSDVSIGFTDSSIVPQSTRIGGQGHCTFSTIYDPLANNQGEQASFGYLGFIGSWRGTGVGNRHVIGSTSATGIGYGVVANMTHATVSGRGGYIPNLPSIIESNPSLYGADNTHDLYIGNSWGHKFTLPPSGITISNYTPVSTEQRIHGQDAYDQTVSPTDTNVKGGHLALCAGRGTDSSIGGEVRILLAPVNQVPHGNVKDTLYPFARFISTKTSGQLILGLDKTNSLTSTTTFRLVGTAAIDTIPNYSTGGNTIIVHNNTTNRLEGITSLSLIGVRGSSTFSGNAVLTTFTVTHGLGSTPAQVLISPTSSAAISPYVTNKTSTTFDVNYLAAPALGTNNVTFDWQATP